MDAQEMKENVKTVEKDNKIVYWFYEEELAAFEKQLCKEHEASIVSYYEEKINDLEGMMEELQNFNSI